MKFLYIKINLVRVASRISCCGFCLFRLVLVRIAVDNSMPFIQKYGEAVVIARNERDEKYLMESYIGGKPEKINSQLANESALRSHILASIAGVFTRSRAELMDFLKKTFFAYQEGTESLASVTNTIVNFSKKKK